MRAFNMGKVSLLTKKQKIILDLISRDKYLSENFYFTGGTALAEFHLKHRLSDDLDFFTKDKIDQPVVTSLIEEWSKQFGYKYSARFVEVVYRFELVFPSKEKIKIDFGHFPYNLIYKGLNFQSMKVDSLRDIATNKMTTVNQRTDVKDFVDLYFILMDHFTVWDLIYSAEAKFPNMIFDRYLLAQDFLKVEDFDVLPKMIKPLKLSDLKSFFRQKARELARKVVKK